MDYEPEVVSDEPYEAPSFTVEIVEEEEQMVEQEETYIEFETVYEYEYVGRMAEESNVVGHVDADPAAPCGAHYIRDCDGNCAPAIWIGNGICNQGETAHFKCPEYFDDGGDCADKHADILTGFQARIKSAVSTLFGL